MDANHHASIWVGLALALGASLGACTGDRAPEAMDCTDGRCESAADREELLTALDGFGDPIAEVLRAAVREDGTVAGDYRDMLAGLREVSGCPQDSEHSFVVLSNEQLSPKTIFAACTSDPQSASRAFVLLPSLNAERDVEPALLHMAAWDEDVGRYRRYATFPDDAGGMRVNVEPTYCLDCHGGPRTLGTWQPLMNEMTNPWSQWNAEPGFASHVFDEYLPADVTEGQVFGEVTDASLLDSASNLEPIIRAGIERVTGARLRARHEPGDVEAALSLLQPAFCDESINFASEVHRSGEIRTAVVVDDAFRALLPLAGGAGWSFLQDITLRIAEPNQSEDNLTLFAVRGESTVQAELALVTRQLLSPVDLLRVHALDWQRPVASAYRCELFDAGVERIRAGALDSAIAELGAESTSGELVPLLFAEILRIDTDAGWLSLTERPEVLTIADAQSSPPEALGDALEPHWISIDELGQTLQDALDVAERSELEARRRQRACDAASRYLTAPIVPGVDC